MDYKEKVKLTWEKFDDIYYKIKEQIDKRQAENSITYLINTLIELNKYISNKNLDDKTIEEFIDKSIENGSNILGFELSTLVLDSFIEFMYNTYSINNDSEFTKEFDCLLESIQFALNNKDITLDYIQ